MTSSQAESPKEGTLIEIEIDGERVFYQVTNARTVSEPLEHRAPQDVGDLDGEQVRRVPGVVGAVKTIFDTPSTLTTQQQLDD